MRLIDADSLLERWNNLSEKDRTRFDRVILCQPIVDTIVVTERSMFPKLILMILKIIDQNAAKSMTNIFLPVTHVNMENGKKKMKM